MPDATGVYSPDDDFSDPADGTQELPTKRSVFGPPTAAGEVGTLGPYRILKELGKGGMGAVYLATDTRLSRKVALKVMLPKFAANQAAKERFLREARAAAQISHDNVVTVHEADERNGVPYMTMQFLQGSSLEDYLRNKGGLPLAHAVRVVREAALGLAAAHEIGLIHRDIKPANLWLEAPNGRVKVLDFGLVKPVDESVNLTNDGMVVGTPAFMSPEQAAGEPLDARSDIFSLGTVLYQLVTGRGPFEGATTMAVLMALANKEPPPVRKLNPDVPEPLAALINQMLAKHPDGRPASAAEVADALAAVAGAGGAPPVAVVSVQTAEVSAFADLGAASDSDDATEAVEPRRRAAKPAAESSGRAPLLIGAAVVALLVVVGGVFALMNMGKGTPKTDPADAANKGGPPIPPPLPPKLPPKPKLPPPAEDADRAAARVVMSTGAYVCVNGDRQKELYTDADLPSGPFRLTSAVFRDEQASDAVLEKLKGCTGLEVISLRGKRVTDAGLAHLKGCTALRDLILDDTAATDAGLAAFADCTQLVIVVLRGPFTDKGVAHLKGCPDIQQANLEQTRVGDGTIAQLARNKSLLLLHLTGPNVTDAGLAALKNCPGLKNLSLDCPNVTEAGVAHLASCPGIDHLSLSGPNVTGAWLKRCRGMTGLMHIALPNAQITDADLEALSAWPALGDVHLEGTAVTDAGLKHLAALPKVRLVVLRKTKVTESGVKELAQAVPGCKIEWDGGVILPAKP